MNKYRAIPTTIDGIIFASKREAARYAELKIMQKAWLITDLQLQPTYQIVINGIKVCKVKLDFSYSKNGALIVEDVKGVDTPVSRLKRKLVKAMHGVDVVIVK